MDWIFIYCKAPFEAQGHINSRTVSPSPWTWVSPGIQLHKQCVFLDWGKFYSLICAKRFYFSTCRSFTVEARSGARFQVWPPQVTTYQDIPAACSVMMITDVITYLWRTFGFINRLWFASVVASFEEFQKFYHAWLFTVSWCCFTNFYTLFSFPAVSVLQILHVPEWVLKMWNFTF